MSTMKKDHFEGLKGDFRYIPDKDKFLRKIKEITGTELDLKNFEMSEIPFMDALKKVIQLIQLIIKLIMFLSSVCM